VYSELTNPCRGLDQSSLKLLIPEIIRELPNGLEGDFPFPSNQIQVKGIVIFQKWT